MIASNSEYPKDRILNPLVCSTTYHVHEDIAHHGHDQLVVRPLLVQHREQEIVRDLDNLLRDRVQPLGDDPDDTIVQQITMLMQHQVVRVSTQQTKYA